ncbi:anhydro-N-acetylmuramic acid kinase [Chitinophaga skermanii]|uniref:Anhydro-N-acetylmuramic acid kinase n=1 Tax=Chitinophaga skermanii TaxID=331697 RepID=A0A327R4D1_9BACT|nr:anhydro-N-acetylmuramic acid kinase [Chitinophaga skermanii]RAJ10624.1 anhydro-N-acetylmuramic acid kinase [Chitinophaga skermanii]
MVYHVIGLMSGSSLDGLDIVKVELTEVRGQWTYEIQYAETLAYTAEWSDKLANAANISAKEYVLLHAAYGRYMGELVNQFIEKNALEHKVHFIASHGHTTFHFPAFHATAQLGDGATLAAVTGLPVISDLRAMDVALGGQGAPIVPIGELMLLPGYDFYLNLGGIANISAPINDQYVAYDICAANRVLNALAGMLGKAYDANGDLAKGGHVDEKLLAQLNALPYFEQAYPKSLDNSFGVDEVLPIIQSYTLSVQTKLRTVVEHIAQQTAKAVEQLRAQGTTAATNKLLVTGGGAHNQFLLEVLDGYVSKLGIDIIVPDEQTVNFKEALIMALMGALRWRQEVNVLSSVTGASRNSVNGALWVGNDV